MTDILLLLLGLTVLTAGAELLIRGASALARRWGMGELVLGLTVVAFGTSAPELAVSVKAALAGQGGIAVGNVVGSNIFNVAVVLGLSALFCPLAVQLKIVRIDMPLLLGASLLFAFLLMTGAGLPRWEGGLLLGLLIVYTTWSVVAGRREEESGGAALTLQASRPAVPTGHPLVGLLLVLLGLGLLVGGAQLFVDHAVNLARHFGVSEAVIGLTIVAAGTSLPELATSLVAALRGRADLAIGNIVGSNLFNLLGIAGLAALVAPIDPEGVRLFDVGIMVATSVLLLPLMRTGFRLVRWEGALLLLSYLGYLWIIWPR